MRILVHVCCGPCAIAVLEALQQEHHHISAFFYNPNIHPLAEYLRRREGAVHTAALYEVPVVMADTLPEAAQCLAPVPPQFPWPSQEQGQNNVAGGTTPIKNAPLPEEPLSARFPVPPAVNPVPWLRAVHGQPRAVHEEEEAGDDRGAADAAAGTVPCLYSEISCPRDYLMS